MQEAMRKRRKRILGGIIALLMVVSVLGLSVFFPRAAVTAASATNSVQTGVNTANHTLTTVQSEAENTYLTDGTHVDTSTQIDTGGVNNPAPQAVWQTVRWNSAFTYTLTGLTPGASYILQLEWAELTWQAAGKREFNVAINGNQILSNFDVYATGGYKRATVKQFTVTADSNGQIVIAFTQGAADNPFINGIELYAH